MQTEKIIGVIGGVGPYAGLDLLKKILEQTAVSTDQEHLTVLNYSGPAHVPDRTAFLLGGSNDNPANGLFEQLLTLEQAGAQVAGIPCNTAHAPAIFDLVKQMLDEADSELQLLNMIAGVATHLRQQQPQIKRIGLLATTGTYRSRVYADVLEPAGFTVLTPDSERQTAVHAAIQSAEYGIKAWGYGTPRAQADLADAMADLQTQGAKAIILGCTELPLAITAKEKMGMLIIDPTLILARALIEAAAPHKLRPLIPSNK